MEISQDGTVLLTPADWTGLTGAISSLISTVGDLTTANNNLRSQIMALQATIDAAAAGNPAPAPTPSYLIEDFEGTLTGLVQTDSHSSISTDVAYSGTKCLRKDLTAGANDTAQAPLRLPQDVPVGGELWMRFRIYVPAGFDWTCTPIMKLMRWAVKTAGGGQAGYISVLTTRPSNYSCHATDATKYGYLVMDDEVVNSTSRPDLYPSGQPKYFCQIGAHDGYLTPGWHTVEMYARVGDNNDGILRAWHNGMLICETTGISTVPPGGAIHKGDGGFTGHILGYWNGGVPKNQSLYFDDFALSYTTPAARDTGGNPMIGP